MQEASYRKPAVIETVKESFAIMAGSFLSALSAGGLPAIAAFALLLAGAVSGVPAVQAVSAVVFVAVLVISFVAAFVVAQAKAIGIEVPTAPGALFLKAQFWKCVAASAVVGLASGGVLAVALVPGGLAWAAGFPAGEMAFVLFAGLLVGIPVAVYVGARLSLLTPSLVAGEPFSVSSAWSMAEGNVFGIFLSTLICSLPIEFAGTIVDAASKNSEQSAVLVSAGILRLALSFVQCLLTGAVAGIYYRELSRIRLTKA